MLQILVPHVHVLIHQTHRSRILMLTMELLQAGPVAKQLRVKSKSALNTLTLNIYHMIYVSNDDKSVPIYNISDVGAHLSC
jgi:hypothetical protein